MAIVKNIIIWNTGGSNNLFVIVEDILRTFLFTKVDAFWDSFTIKSSFSLFVTTFKNDWNESLNIFKFNCEN